MAAEEGKKKATNKKRKQSEVVQEPSKSSTAPLNRLNSHNIANATVKPMEKGELSESLKHMMFGHGDCWEPDTQTVDLMEDIVTEYVSLMTQNAMELSVMKGKLDTDCFTFLLRHDEPKYKRIKQLLHSNEILRSASSSGFDPSDEKQYS